LEYPGVDGGIILKWIFERLNGGHRLDRSGSGQGHVAVFCEYDDELSGSINVGNFLSGLGRVSFSGRTLLHGVSYVCMYVAMFVYMYVCM
jgi:hypothetical protein